MIWSQLDFQSPTRLVAAPMQKFIEDRKYSWVILPRSRDKIFRRDTFGGGNGIEQGTNVAVKVINRKTAPVSFLKKFLPRELDVARKLGMALSLIEISASSAIYGLVSALLNSYIVKNHWKTIEM